MTAARASRVDFRRSATLMRSLAANLKAIASGRNLLVQIDGLRKAQDGVEVQYMRVISSLVGRHYGAAPVPPPELRIHVGATDSALNFWAKGISSSQLVLDAFGGEPAGPVLDWGCGSGRTRFWLRAYPAWNERYYGCDVDEAAIGWLQEHGEPRVSVCGDEPPLPYADGQFAGLFSFSVLTHIPPDRHDAWYQEVARVLRPGGVALITTDSRTGDVPPRLADEFARTGAVFATAAGHYKHLCRVSEAFTRAAIGASLAVDEVRPNGYLGQDVIVAHRPMEAS